MKLWYQSLSRQTESTPYGEMLRRVINAACDPGTTVHLQGVRESAGIGVHYRFLEYHDTREVIYNAMKDYDKALAASDRALALVYGPRKLAVLSVRTEIFTGKGDTKAARETMVQAIEYAKSLPEGQRSDRRIAALEKRLAGMQ